MLHKAFFLFVCFFVFSFFASLGPLGLILVRHFLRECGNAAMPQSGKNTTESVNPAARQLISVLIPQSSQ